MGKRKTTKYKTGRVLVGSCLDRLKEMPDASIDSIVTDPPYELGFMGKSWDASGIAYSVGLWRETLRVLKPGGHLLAFGGTRTYHRMAVAIEDAGFEIRDSLHWVYGSGFPKSHSVPIAIDKEAGAMSHRGKRASVAGNIRQGENVEPAKAMPAHEGVTDAAKQWQGWGTALKPAHEPIVLARKPLDGTVAANVLEHGTGALNIDGCRIGSEKRTNPPAGNGRAATPSTTTGASNGGAQGGFNYSPDTEATVASGRWPANIIFDEAAGAELDAQSGVSGGGQRRDNVARTRNNGLGLGTTEQRQGTANSPDNYGDTGGASRFFYCSKPGKRERNAGLDGANAHPTVKPVELMRYLCRLITPPGGVVLDPFLGSGTTAVAAILEGLEWVGCEMTEDYLPIIKGRVQWAQRQQRPLL